MNIQKLKMLNLQWVKEMIDPDTDFEDQVNALYTALSNPDSSEEDVSAALDIAEEIFSNDFDMEDYV